MKTIETIRSTTHRQHPGSIPGMCHLAALFLATVATAAGMLFFKLPQTSLLWSALQNSGHFVAFLGLSLVYTTLATRAYPSRKNFIVIGTVLILGIVGIGIELLQLTQHDRSTSIADVLRNFAGTVAGILIFLAFLNKKLWSGIILITLALGICCLVNTTSLALTGYQLLKSGKPYLINFNDRFVESGISPAGGANIALVESLPVNPPLTGRALRVDFSSRRYTGVRFHNTQPPWESEEKLIFKIYNPEKTPQQIHLRIHDTEHDNTYSDRFNMVFQLSPGLNTLPVKVSNIETFGDNMNNRKMNLQQISEIQIFSTRKIPSSILIYSIQRTR